MTTLTNVVIWYVLGEHKAIVELQTVVVMLAYVWISSNINGASLKVVRE